MIILFLLKLDRFYYIGGYELKESIVIWGLRATFFFLKTQKNKTKTPEKHKTLSKKHKDT